MKTKLRKLTCGLLIGAALLSLSACGGGDSAQKTMAGAMAAAAQEALTDVDKLYSNGYLVFTPGEDSATYVMMGFYYAQEGEARENTALGLFQGEELTSFALKGVDGDAYDTLLEAMPKENTEKYAKSSLIEQVCKDSGLGTADQAKTDLGI